MIALTYLFLLLAWASICAGFMAVRSRIVQRRYSDPEKLTFYGPVQWVKLWWWLLTTSGRLEVHGITIPRRPWEKLDSGSWS